MEKLDVQIHEYILKVEELNRTILDVTSIKMRLSTVGLSVFHCRGFLETDPKNVTPSLSFLGKH